MMLSLLGYQIRLEWRKNPLRQVMLSGQQLSKTTEYIVNLDETIHRLQETTLPGTEAKQLATLAHSYTHEIAGLLSTDAEIRRTLPNPGRLHSSYLLGFAGGSAMVGLIFLLANHWPG